MSPKAARRSAQNRLPRIDYNQAMIIITVVTPVLPNSATSRAIGELTCQQTTAYNEAVALLNRGTTIPKRSTRKEPHGFNNLLTRWLHTRPFLRKVPYSIHQTGWEQAWEANERMRNQSTLRRKRIERAQTHGQPPKKRDTRQHRRTLEYRRRKDNPSLTITEGRRLSAKGHTITFQHRHFEFTIRTKFQNLDQLDIRSMQLVPCQDYAPNVPLDQRQYLAHIQINTLGGIPDELPAITQPHQILGFDRGRKKPAAASNGQEIQYDPLPDVAERKADYKSVRTKKQGSKRQHHAKTQAARRSHKRIQRRRTAKRHQVKTILRDAQPKAVAVESLRLSNMLASAAGTKEHPGVNVAAKRALNRAIAEASMGETNQIIHRECERLEIPVVPVPAAGTSQTCPRCGYRDPHNRESQAVFKCQRCTFTDNADFTASRIVRNRAYALYCDPNVTVEQAPTGWLEQPSQRCGEIPLFRIESEIKPTGGATALSTHGDQGPAHKAHDRIQPLLLVA